MRRRNARWWATCAREGWRPRARRRRSCAWPGFGPSCELWLAEPERDAALLRAQGYEIEVEGGVVQVRLESHAQIKEVLAAVSPLDMRLAEPRLEEAFLRLSEAA